MNKDENIKVNLEALKKVSNHIDFSELNHEPVKQTIAFTDFEDIAVSVSNLLNAIQFIGFNGNENELGLCGTLAQLALKIMPVKELKLLDELVLKKSVPEQKVKYTPKN